MRLRNFVMGGALLVGTGACVLARAGAPLTEAVVRIDNFSFGAGQIVVARGTKVTWSNQDDIPHTVTDAAEKRDFKSGPLDTGGSFSHVFSAPGVYHYFCSLHPKMQGIVLVK